MPACRCCLEPVISFCVRQFYSGVGQLTCPAGAARAADGLQNRDLLKFGYLLRSCDYGKPGTVHLDRG